MTSVVSHLKTGVTVHLGRLPGLTAVARARWPEPGDPPAPPVLPGFVVSTFSPLVAAVAERCLRRAPAIPDRTAIVVVTRCGDATSAAHLARAVDAGARIGPLLFFQSVPNAVAGYLAARHGLDGPVVCLSPAAAGVAAALADGRSEAALLVADADVNAVLVVAADQDPDRAAAELLRPAPASGSAAAPASGVSAPVHEPPAPDRRVGRAERGAS